MTRQIMKMFSETEDCVFCHWFFSLYITVKNVFDFEIMYMQYNCDCTYT